MVRAVNGRSNFISRRSALLVGLHSSFTSGSCSESHFRPREEHFKQGLPPSHLDTRLGKSTWEKRGRPAVPALGHAASFTSQG